MDNNDTIDIAGIYDGQAVILLNDGSGKFYNIGEYIGEDVTRLDIGDLNNDGILDIAIANPTYIASFTGDGQLNFVFDEVIFSFSEHNDAKIADLDGDGQEELIPSSDLTALELIDVDADGDLDAIFSEDGGSTTLHLNDGWGNFDGQPISLGAGDVTVIVSGDLNQDQLPDIFLGRYNGQDNLLMNTGLGNFTDSGIVFDTVQTTDACIEDVNGDGWADLVIGTDSAEENVIYYNNGYGTLSQDLGSLGDEKIEKVHCTDVDNDGINDLVMSKDGKLVIE